MICRHFVLMVAAIVLLSVFACGQPLTVEQALDRLKSHQFGQNTEMLDFLRDAAARSQVDPETRKNFNAGLLDILQSNAPYAAKQFACRLLVLTATGEQASVLGTYLSDPHMSHMALYVLTHLQGPDVDQAMIQALTQTDGNTQLGIITALGNRKAVEAVDSLVALLESGQETTVSEAALALGRIGIRESAEALNNLTNRYPSTLPAKVADAILTCADNLMTEDPKAAQAMYVSMLKSNQSSITRCAALNGLGQLLGSESLSIILIALRGSNPLLRNTAAQIARTLPGSQVTHKLAQTLDTLTPETQVLIIKALAERSDNSVLKSIQAATQSPSVQVRIAALQALQSLGNKSVIRLLTDRAVEGTPHEKATAKDSLCGLTGPRINAEIIAQLKLTPPAQQVVLIEALAKRQAFDTAQTLLVTAHEGTTPVRTASLKALGKIGAKGQIETLALLLTKESQLQDITGQALTQIAQRTNNAEAVSVQLLDGLKTAKTTQLRRTLLYTLGQIKHEMALPELVAALKETDEVLRYNAIKALGTWPNVSPAPHLLAVAQTASNKAHRILALRGYIHLVSVSTLPATDKLEQYQQAITLAVVAEKKSILAKLPDLQVAPALEMASEYLNNPDTVNEAAQAAITLASYLLAQDPDAATDGMRQVIESAVADSFKQKAQQILQQITKIKGSMVPATYQALERRSVVQGRPWAILERDGASRSVKAYLSSLAQGETATGVIASPEFVVTMPTITFTLCGHDGQGGGRGEDFMALVDVDTGRILKKTTPPNRDDMESFTWDVGQLKGTSVCIEVHDGNPNTAYAWLGVGSIDASPAFKINFSQGMPMGWASPEQKVLRRVDLVTGDVPFRQATDLSSLIPEQGSTELPCGFLADRLFFLGCTVDIGQAATCYGGIELHYRTGSPDVFPLLCGYTLNALQPLANQPKATHLHGAGNPNQFYLVIIPRRDIIEKIRLVAEPKRGPIPQITGITCETTASHDRLVPLAIQSISPQEADWIDSHSVSAESPELGSVMQSIRKRFNAAGSGTKPTIPFKKHQIDSTFRSEAVAVADFDGDGQLDIATGNLYYSGPHWKMVPMLDPPIEFNRFGYSSAFLCFPDDIDHDGHMDLIVVGFPGQQTHWLENPGQTGSMWKKHLAVSKTDNESPMYVDVNGDGRKALLFFFQGRCVFAQPGENPRKPWPLTTISSPGDPAPGHGLGVGDLNSDGRTDVLIPNGWWEAPSKTTASAWPFHKAELFGGAQLCVHDFDADGDMDVLGSSAHGYGIAWSEQTIDGWKMHEIDNTDSQTHALHLADINADGLMDFVTGKRFWAHNGHDPGSFQPAVLCWYEQQDKRDTHDRPQWTKHVIDYDSGVGLHFQIIDINGDGRLDIVTSNKKGVHLFQQIMP